MKAIFKIILIVLLCEFLTNSAKAELQSQPLRGSANAVNSSATQASFKLGVLDTNSSYAPSNIGIIGIKYLHRPGDMSTVIEVYPGTPAEKAGVRIGDRLLEVDNVSIIPFSSDQVFGLIAGRPGEHIKLKLMRCNRNYGTSLGCSSYDVDLVRMDMAQINSDRIFKIYRYGEMY